MAQGGGRRGHDAIGEGRDDRERQGEERPERWEGARRIFITDVSFAAASTAASADFTTATSASMPVDWSVAP